MKIGIKGISYSATERKYLVRVVRNSKRVYLGRYSSLEEAKQALNQEENKEDTPEELPILSSLRAEFASKSKKPTKNNVQKTQKPQSLVKELRQERTVAVSAKVKTGYFVASKETATIAGPSTEEVQANLTKQMADKTLEVIIKRLLELANERKTSVFDVIVQEVARLSKK